jgi:hypothetical protein
VSHFSGGHFGTKHFAARHFAGGYLAPVVPSHDTITFRASIATRLPASCHLTRRFDRTSQITTLATAEVER